MEVLGICLPYVKMYFQEHHLSTFFFMGQITQILLFSGILLLERSKITVREQHFFKKKIVMEVLGLHLPYIKRYFQKHQLSAFYFMAQITQILLFLGMLLLERSKITVWEWCLFKTRFAMEVLGLCVPYIRRYFQEHHSSVFFFMAQISQILLFSGMLILQWSNITVWAQ